MLTSEAHLERKWGHFPTLRTILQDKQIPDGHDMVLSAQDTLLNYLNRLAEIAVIARGYSANIIEAESEQNHDQLHKDIKRLRDELEYASKFYREHTQLLEGLLDAIERRGYQRNIQTHKSSKQQT